MKRLISYSLALLCVAALVVLALPSVVGSKWVYQPLVDRLAAEKFQLKIDDLQLGWFRPISFSRIELSGPQSPPSDQSLPPGQSLPPDQRLPSEQNSQSPAKETSLVKIESIRSDRSLIGFLWHGRNLGTIEVIQPNVDVRLLEDGSNLGRLIRELTSSTAKVEADHKQPKKPPLMDIQIVVRGFHVTVTDEQTTEPIVVIPPFDASVSYKAIDVEPQVTITSTKALNQVVITQRLIHLGLAKAVPLLANSTEFDGQISLESGPITIPLGHPQDATGSAVLTLHSVRTVPTDPTIKGAIDLVGRLFKRQLPHELIFVDGSTINVEIANQIVRHDGVRAGLPAVDARLQIATSGSVGLEDRKLDLGIEIPIPVEQLARRQTVKQLGVPSITLPIKGTLDKPEIDWTVLRQDSADLLSALQSALSDEAPLAGAVAGALSGIAEGNTDQALEEGVDLVKQLLLRRQQRLESQPAETQQDPLGDSAEESKLEKSGRPVRDALKNLFRDR